MPTWPLQLHAISCRSTVYTIAASLLVITHDQYESQYDCGCNGLPGDPRGEHASQICRSSWHHYLNDTWSVKKDHLIVGLREDAKQFVPCGLSFAGHDGELLSQHGIQQCALASIRPSYQSYVACTPSTVHRHFSSKVVRASSNIRPVCSLMHMLCSGRAESLVPEQTTVSFVERCGHYQFS